MIDRQTVFVCGVYKQLIIWFPHQYSITSLADTNNMLNLTFYCPPFVSKTQREKDELNAVIQEMKEDAETLNEKFAQQQEETSKEGDDYEVH